MKTLLPLLLPFLLFAQAYYIDTQSGLYIADEKTQPKLSWSDGKEYCSSLNLGGYSDWYMPSIEQMVRFEDRTNTKTFLKKELKNTHRYDYWSSTPDAMNSEYAWSQGLMYKAYNHTHNKDEKKYIRCVRGEKYKKPYYIKYKDVVVDKTNHFMWQDDVNASALTLDFDDALRYCENLSLLGFSDWSLPDIKTLRYLVDTTRYTPAIDPAFKHTAIDGGYLSESFYEPDYDTDDEFVEAIGFNHGIDGHSSTDEKHYFRCVRKLKPTKKKVSIQVFFQYDNAVVYIDGKKITKLHTILDDYQGTNSIELTAGVYKIEVKRISRDGKTMIYGSRVINIQKGTDVFVKVLATQKR